jgi:hypothetical protein
MSEPNFSYLQGDFEVKKRDDYSGGNLRVAGDLEFAGVLIGALPDATDSTPGAVLVEQGSGLEVSAGALSWTPLYRYKNGLTTYQGGGHSICVSAESLAIDDSGEDAVLRVNLKSGGGIVADQTGAGLRIDSDAAKTIIGLKAAAYKEVAANTGDSTDANKIPELGSGGVLNYAAIPADYVRNAGLQTALANYVTIQSQTTTLSAYLTTASFNDQIAAYVTSAALETKLEDYVTLSAQTATLAGYVTTAYLSATLASYATSASVSNEIYSALLDYALEDHQHAVVPVTGVPASGIISIAENQQQYRCVVTGNTVLGFDATGVQGAGNSVTFELVLTMGSRVYPVLFGPTIAWLDGDEPLFNLPNTTYLIAFRSYDGGETWIGAYQGCY